MDRKLIIALVILCISWLSCSKRIEHSDRSKPLIYCSDLYHPHQDPDDHFDIVSIYALQEFDVKAIILDDGGRQVDTPGSIPVKQLNYLTDRKIPYAIGLSKKLKSTEDTGIDEPEEFQNGVDTILEVLNKAEEPVTIIAVGSLRDIAAAFNRDPELLRNKVRMLMIFIGEASKGYNEYNVKLDEKAFVKIMNSGLPVYWVPCFDKGVKKGEKHASYWKADHSELLKEASKEVLNFFTYALLRKNHKDYNSILHNEVISEEKERIFNEERNLWCTAVFTYAAGRKIVERNGEWIAVRKVEVLPTDETVEIFRFNPVSVLASGRGELDYSEHQNSNNVNRFQVIRKDIYYRAMTSVTRNLIGELSGIINNK